MSLLRTPAEIRNFLIGFVGLTLVSGLTIGMNKVLATLLGLHLNVSNLQLATISSAETFAMALGTLPAGYILSRGNPKYLYAGVSLTLAAIFCILPWLPHWQWVALIMFLVGLCISLRVVAMSTVFLVRLPELGQGKAGWYKGTLMLGIQFLGPLSGNYLIAHLGLQAGFVVSALMFTILAVLGWQILPSSTGSRKTVGGQIHASSWRELLQLPAVRITYLFEILASFTASSVGVFSILLAIRVLRWPQEHAVWLMATQGLGFVAVLLLLGKAVLQSRHRDRYYALAHLAIMLSLLLFGLFPTSATYLFAAALLGLGLGVNSLVNTDRIAHAPVDKAKISSHLTLFGMAGGTIGALAAGHLADVIGLRQVFLIWLAPWLAAWFYFHGQRSDRRDALATRPPVALDALAPPQGEVTR
ncbi:MFS transporter [Janthinobacterium sp. 17J80-10]|uniref:MFS transporter n=1 Tax=Janthinobacterium sp. 17J80-10 TaxID=2497863 RepID=UPI0010053CC2|nr:MFS transporter [Janthinobacterium sp. 17J80-10]QAU33964.1 MFS transporter [Janthinobacterium sp. 17J80-10]